MAILSRRDSAERFRELGVDVFLGEAAFADRDILIAHGEELVAGVVLLLLLESFLLV